MLLNPFAPSEIAGLPEDFFGRRQELHILERALDQGSVALQGGIGIGKSSLLARIRLLMEGFDSSHSSKSVIAVGDKDVKTVDDAARLILEAFIHIDEVFNKVQFKLGPIFEIESTEVCSYFKTGRHLAALKRIVENEYMETALAGKEFLILAIDEADKCPVPIARLIRSLITHTQQNGVKNVRFIVAGVSPFFQAMVDEDAGINRFFYKTITLLPLPKEEATELVETKLIKAIRDAEKRNISLRVDPTIIARVVDLSGGHPHLLQLLGSHLIEREDADPDGIINSQDLVSALRKICYEDRARVYTSTIHLLELHDMLEPLKNLFDYASTRFPTKINRSKAKQVASKKSIEWLITNNILSVLTDEEYGLIDEFLRIRMLMDEVDQESEARNLEKRLVELGSLEDEERLETRAKRHRHLDDDSTEQDFDDEEDNDSSDDEEDDDEKSWRG